MQQYERQFLGYEAETAADFIGKDGINAVRNPIT